MKRREPPSDRDPGIAFVLAAIVVLGVRPLMFALTSWPASRDGALWILRGLPTNPEWASWVFGSKHFVGYRPLTALSYTLNAVVAGFAPWAYRLTDLVVHVLCILLVYALYRRLAPALPRWGGAVAAGVFAAHPVVAEVVPHLARRSYSLATMFSLAALVVAAGGLAGIRAPWGRNALTALLAFCALLSNEVAYMTVPVLLLVAAREGRREGRGWGAVAGACSGALVAFAAALSLRLLVAGGIGGYATGVDRGERVLPIAAATWRTLLSMTGLREPAHSPSLVVVGLFLAIAAYYGWRLLRASAEERGTRILAAWLVGYTLLFAPLGVWFPRQMYPLVAPLALLVGITAAASVVRLRAGDRGAAIHLLPQLVLVFWMLAHSPAVLGSDPARAAAWMKNDLMLRDAASRLAALPESGPVRLALPHYRRTEVVALRARPRDGRPPLAAELPSLWLEALLADRPAEPRAFLTYELDPIRPDSRPQASGDGAPAIVLPADTRFWLFEAGADAGREGNAPRVPLGDHLLPVYFHDGEQGRLVAR